MSTCCAPKGWRRIGRRRVMRAKDGTLVEMFEWASPAAIEEAHANPRVQAMWARFAACCDYVPLNSLAEAGDMFAEFEPVHIHWPSCSRAGQAGGASSPGRGRHGALNAGRGGHFDQRGGQVTPTRLGVNARLALPGGGAVA